MVEASALPRLYAIMESTRAARAEIVRRLLEERAASLEGPPARRLPPEPAAALREALETLRELPGDGVLQDLSYEIGELEKDLFFLHHPPGDFLRYLADLHPGLQGEVEAGVSFLEGLPPVLLLTDRDGTVNNYSSRYRSSVQPAWNGVFLSRYALRRARSAVIISSAPLEQGGLLDVSVMPRELFIWAGSLGREFLDREGKRHRLAVEPRRQEKLDALNRGLESLLDRPEHRIFALIGSGLQRKFGQTTVARQDIHGTVPAQESARFLERVRDLVHRLDPSGELLRVEDTGRDIEIILAVAEGRPFDKGDGIAFIDRELSLGLAGGPNLIGGDTPSDLAMVRAAAGLRRERTWAVFVTREEGLRREVASICPRSFFVSEPDTLVLILERLAGQARQD